MTTEEEPVEISMDDLGWLICCAVHRNTRIPYGIVPEHLWARLSPEWQRRVRERQGAEES